MELFYCGNQWGYTPLGNVVNVPPDHCFAPTNLQATASFQFVTFSWVAPHDYVYFTLEYREVGSPTWLLEDVAGTSIILSLEPSKTYEWRVKTICDKIGPRVSSYANGPNITTGDIVEECIPVAMVTITNMGSFYRASWAATGATNYKVVLDDNVQQQFFYTTATQYDFIGLPPGSEWRVTVVSICRRGETAPSPIVSMVISSFGICEKPLNLVLQATSTTIIASWLPSPSPGFITYNVYLNGTLIAPNFGPTSITIPQLTPNTAYTVEVRTNCRNNYSEAITGTITTLLTPCNATFALSAAAIQATQFTLNWVTTLNGSTLSGIRLVVNNGVHLSLAANETTIDIAGMPSGSIVKIDMYGLCTNGSMTAISTLNVQLTGNGIIVFDVTDKTNGNMTISWAPLANALYYIVNDGVNDYKELANRFKAYNVVRGQAYTFTVTPYAMVEGEETAGAPVQIIETYAASGCTNYIIDKIIWNSPTTALLTFSTDATKLFGGPIRIWISNNDQSVTYFQQIVYNTGEYLITGLTEGQAYDVAVYRVGNGNTGNLPASDGCNATQTVYTHAPCYTPGQANVLLEQTSSTNLRISLTGTSHQPTQTGYEIEWALEEGINTKWNRIAGTTLFASFPVNIAVPGYGMYKVRMRINCNSQWLPWVEYAYSCRDVQSLTLAVDGTTVRGEITDQTEGNYLYSIAYSTLGLSEWSGVITSNLFEINDLLPNRVYSLTVKTICTKDRSVVSTGKTVVFTTGAIGNASCLPPEISAYIEDCDVTEPIGGADPEVPSTSDCIVKSIDWNLESLFIMPLGTDPENSLFFEAAFSISISTTNIETLLPGGTMGVIETAACRPGSTSLMSLELVTGAGNLVVPAASIDTDGKITCSGSFTGNNSSVLVLRVRGSYLKA